MSLLSGAAGYEFTFLGGDGKVGAKLTIGRATPGAKTGEFMVVAYGGVWDSCSLVAADRVMAGFLEGRKALSDVILLQVGPYQYLLVETDEGQFVVPAVDDENVRPLSGKEIIKAWIDVRDKYEPGQRGYDIDFGF